MGKSEKINPDGWARTSVCYSNIYYECLRKLLEDCSETMGECQNCSMHCKCLPLWDVVTDKEPRGSRLMINSDTFPIVVLQFAKLRDKAQEHAHQLTKHNYKLYQQGIIACR